MTEVAATLRDLERRLTQDPDNLLLRVQVATLLTQLGRGGEAARLLRSVAFTYRDCGKYAEAVAVARSILDIVPADTAIHTLLAELENRDDEVTETRSGVALREESTLVEPVSAVSERSQSASAAALIARPRILSRPPPLRAHIAPPSHNVMSEETPLPGALPYHIAEPTTPASQVPFGVFGAASSRVAGLAEAARRITGLIAEDPRDEGLAVDSAWPLRRGGPLGSASAVGGDLAQHDGGTYAEEELTSPRLALPGELLPDSGSVHAELHGDTAESSHPLANLFFASLPEAYRVDTLQKFESRFVAAGTVVVRRGSPTPPLIAVVRGKLELRVESLTGSAAILDTIEAGHYIGEAALLGGAAPGTIVAAEDCDLLTLSPAALFELASAYPALWAALKDMAERRKRRYDSIIRALP